MKALGLIGGTGPKSTIDYYRSLIATYRARIPDTSYPRIIINSVDNQKLLAWVGANATHIVFDESQRVSPVPLLSIIEATCAAAKAAGLKNT